VDLKYITKDLNIFGEQVERLLQLPTTYNAWNFKGCYTKLVLKEDVAALYETSWEKFKQGTASRLAKWSELLRHVHARACVCLVVSVHTQMRTHLSYITDTQ